MLEVERESVAPMRKNGGRLIVRTIAAHAGLFLAISLVIGVSFFIVFGVAVSGFAGLAESQHPGSMDTPLSGLGPLLAAGFVTVLFHIAVLAVLTYLRGPLVEFFLLLISVTFASLIAAWYIEIGVLRYSKGWYPVLRTPVREYPVLVVTPDERTGLYHARVIQWADLALFCRDHPQYSFLVPDGQDSDLLS
jgi:hypothetical protein